MAALMHVHYVRCFLFRNVGRLYIELPTLSTNIKYICTELIKREEELVIDIEALCGFNLAGLVDWLRW
jgi:hypothetical protein